MPPPGGEEPGPSVLASGRGGSISRIDLEHADVDAEQRDPARRLSNRTARSIVPSPPRQTSSPAPARPFVDEVTEVEDGCVARRHDCMPRGPAQRPRDDSGPGEHRRLLPLVVRDDGDRVAIGDLGPRAQTSTSRLPWPPRMGESIHA